MLMKKKDIKIITTFNGGYSSTTPNSIQNSPVHYCQPAESQINFKVPSDKKNSGQDLSKRIENIKAKYKGIMHFKKISGPISTLSPKLLNTPLLGLSPVNVKQMPLYIEEERSNPLTNNFFFNLEQKHGQNSNKQISKGPVSRKDITISVKDYIKNEFIKGVANLNQNKQVEEKNEDQKSKPVFSISTKISVTPSTRSKCTTPIHIQISPSNKDGKGSESGNNRKSLSHETNGIQILLETNIISSNAISNNTRGPTSTTNATESRFKVNETIQERDRLIKYIRAYCKTHNEIPPTTIENYKLIKLIGRGAFGKVSLGIHKLTGKYVAIKSIEKSVMKDEFQKRKVQREIYIMKRLEHSNIVSLLEVFESAHHLLLVMEYSDGGDLLQYVKRKGGLKENEARKIFRQIIYGIAHIHCRNILHRDIKLDNILMDSREGIKICDFGVSKIITSDMLIKEQCGTPAYIAPEIISKEGYSGFGADIWSAGVLLYTMLMGVVPFKAGNMNDLKKLIGTGNFLYPEESSPSLKSLLKGMLTVNPRNRISIPEILQHPWLKGPASIHEIRYKSIDFKSQPGKLVEKPNVHNIFPYNRDVYITKDDYYYIINEYYSHNIDEEALEVTKTLGFSREYVISTINSGILNHATATYHLVALN